jgi:hypothetical protein
VHDSKDFDALRRACARPVASLLLAVMSLEACHHWVPTNRDAIETLRNRGERSLRVTATGRSRRELFAPRIDGNFLVGLPTPLSKKDTVHLDADGFPFRPDTLAIPLTEIQSVEVSRIHPARTILFFTALTGVVLLFGAIASDDLHRKSGGWSCGFFCWGLTAGVWR